MKYLSAETGLGMLDTITAVCISSHNPLVDKFEVSFASSREKKSSGKIVDRVYVLLLIHQNPFQRLHARSRELR